MPIKAKDYIKETLKERPELEAPLREVMEVVGMKGQTDSLALSWLKGGATVEETIEMLNAT